MLLAGPNARKMLLKFWVPTLKGKPWGLDRITREPSGRDPSVNENMNNSLWKKYLTSANQNNWSEQEFLKHMWYDLVDVSQTSPRRAKQGEGGFIIAAAVNLLMWRKKEVNQTRFKLNSHGNPRNSKRADMINAQKASMFFFEILNAYLSQNVMKHYID